MNRVKRRSSLEKCVGNIELDEKLKMTKLKKFKDRWNLVSEDFNESERAAVKIFAVIFKELIKESNPAKFYNGRGQLLYAKYNFDFEEEIKNLLDFENYEKEC